MKSALLAALLLASAAAPLRAAADERAQKRIAFVIDDAEPGERGLADSLAAAYRTRASVTRYELDDERMSNPIAKGKLLAELENSDLIVAVGDGATEFAAGEVEDVPVFFVDATVVKGSRLASSSIGGLFSYSIEAMLDAAKALRLSPLGLAFTPGYEPVAEWVRAGAAARGLSVVEKKISAPKDLAPAVRELLDHSRSLWLVGDPLLMRGAGFDFIRERSLSLSVPIVSPGRWGVEHGALIGYQPETADQTASAERSIDALLRGTPGPRLVPAMHGGTLLINAALAAKWNFAPARGLRWKTVR